jgi:hypothetical protein
MWEWADPSVWLSAIVAGFKWALVAFGTAVKAAVTSAVLGVAGSANALLVSVAGPTNTSILYEFLGVLDYWFPVGQAFTLAGAYVLFLATFAVVKWGLKLVPFIG